MLKELAFLQFLVFLEQVILEVRGFEQVLMDLAVLVALEDFLALIHLIEFEA